MICGHMSEECFTNIFTLSKAVSMKVGPSGP